MSENRVRVLIVEDEADIRRFVRMALESEGHEVFEADCLKRGLIEAGTRRPELVVLDLGLPDGDGVDFIRDLRAWSTCPVIVLSARSGETDKIAALDAEADDYLVKPFGAGELLARISVALRHARSGNQPQPSCFEAKGLSVDFSSRLVSVDGKEIRLTPTEYKLLSVMVHHAGKVVTHGQLLREVWGNQYADATHYVHVHVASLRRKIEENPARPALIQTESGVGYRLRGRE